MKYSNCGTRGVIAVLALVLNAQAFAQAPTVNDLVSGNTEVESPKEGFLQPEKAVSVPQGPIDELDRGVPRTSVMGFLKVSGERNWSKAASYLDLRQLPKGYKAKHRPKLARQFKLVLDDTLELSASRYISRLSQLETPWYS